ncbi:MAG: UDP-N-acetylglucosamine 1-carboxyvinyltransferase [Clostridiaceae bacterium]|jgi:UDP-N-acetylglucosamine 1-carboxyvinyltransferase|nr:UDP-N-acetylglucosamine 1-carboxyvinyltransferase [Clostridiaceae bacterium]
MERFEVVGGKELFGTVRLSGAKNSVLPLLAASILTEDEVIIEDCPKISDVERMLDILRLLGVSAERDGARVRVCGRVRNTDIPDELAGEMRSSIFLLGSILAVAGEVHIAYPGGCDIGARPLNLHFEGFRKLNIEVHESGYIHCSARCIKGADMVLSLPSVGATENLMLASVFCEGETIIRNAAKEPEIVDLATFLRAMGADVDGDGTSVISIRGVKRLRGVRYTPIPDRIICGTIITAVAAAGGAVTVENCVPEHCAALIGKIPKTACRIEAESDKISLYACGRGEAARLVDTSPYPGFPTDMQPQFMALQAVSRGVCVVRENIFETRFRHVQELVKMGADITIGGRIAVIRGGKLKGAEVTATDLRGGAGLVIAGLAAEGRTVVKNLLHIDRGYENLELLLSSLGAEIKRLD